MLGTEQALLENNPFKHLFYKLFGNLHMGERVRFCSVVRLLNDRDFSNCSILDAGCGKGIISFYLARRFPYSKIISIDTDVGLIEKARLIRTKIKMRNINFEVKSILDLDQSEQFDLIVCIDVLEHIENDFGASQNLSNSLTKGGILIIHVPQKFQKHPFRKMEWKGHHVREGYIPQELINLLQSVNLKILQVRHTFGIFGALAAEIEYTLWRVKPIWLIAYPLLLLFTFIDVMATHSRGHAILVKAVRH